MSISVRGSDGKGQTALEFMMIMVLLMLVFAAVYSSLGERSVVVAERNVQLQAADMADRIGYELDLALAEGEGFSRTFELRPEIGGAEYNVTISGGTIRLSWKGSQVFSETAATNTVGEVEPGRNTVRNNGTHVVVQG